jgi:hypothetical protein
MQDASDTYKHLIKRPCISWPRPATAEALGELSAERLAPSPAVDPLCGSTVADHHTTLGQARVDITQG